MKRELASLAGWLTLIVVILSVGACLSSAPLSQTPAAGPVRASTFAPTNGHVVNEEGNTNIWVIQTNHLPTPAGIVSHDIVVTNRVRPLVVGQPKPLRNESYAADYPPIPSNSLSLNLIAVCATSTDLVHWMVIGTVPYPVKGGTLTCTVTNGLGTPKRWVRFGFGVLGP